jgi:cation transport ATPase
MVFVLSTSLNEETLLRYAAAIEGRSEHPIARGIVSSPSENALHVESFKALLGRGVEGVVQSLCQDAQWRWSHNETPDHKGDAPKITVLSHAKRHF